MNLGQKIKAIRTEKMMTQKELSGSEITRNMLSQIESGSAQPSLSTIIYLAGKLGVPAGYLLSEGDEEFLYNKTNAMKNIKRAYKDHSFELCREMCLSYFEDDLDDELQLILVDSCLGFAFECALNGKLHLACRLLDEALSHADKTMYSTSLQKNKILVTFGFLKQMSPTLDSYEVDTDDISSIMNPYLYDDVFTKYITLISNSNEFDIDEVIRSSNISNEYDRMLLAHLKARQSLNTGKHEKSRQELLQIIDGAITPPRLLLYLSCCDMEICCKEGNDYKGAYEFSNNKMEILEHMLVDD